MQDKASLTNSFIKILKFHCKSLQKIHTEELSKDFLNFATSEDDIDIINSSVNFEELTNKISSKNLNTLEIIHSICEKLNQPIIPRKLQQEVTTLEYQLSPLINSWNLAQKANNSLEFIDKRLNNKTKKVTSKEAMASDWNQIIQQGDYSFMTSSASEINPTLHVSHKQSLNPEDKENLFIHLTSGTPLEESGELALLSGGKR